MARPNARSSTTAKRSTSLGEGIRCSVDSVSCELTTIVLNSRNWAPAGATLLLSTSKELLRPSEHRYEKSQTKNHSPIAERFCLDDGHVPGHHAPHQRHGRHSVHPHRTATRKRRGDDLAWQAIRPRDQALLPQDRPLPNF